MHQHKPHCHAAAVDPAQLQIDHFCSVEYLHNFYKMNKIYTLFIGDLYEFPEMKKIPR
jgi:hypothetical protein